MPATPSFQSTPLHIAGVGASAGGLEAMLAMFAGMRSTGRITYIVAQHMAHNGHSELVVRLINRESALPVVLARAGENLRADRVYVIPAGQDGTVNGATLNLRDPSPGHLSTPSVNALFTSIAESSRRHAIGILLSGTGSDGVAGCRALKARGGLTIAQDPRDAKFDGMPGAAIQARLVDKILPASAMGAALAALFPGPAIPAPPRSPAVNAPVPETPTPEPGHRELEPLLRLVHQATGIDFSGYKTETLLRRLEKRKNTLGITNSDEYLALVRRRPEELKTLQHLFLVSVSSFFRDRESFRELERALAVAVANKPDGEPIRVWVPGCASGEEPYTLAILLNELLRTHQSSHVLSILGTDLNPEALAMAQAGVYRKTAFREMEEALRERYFMAKGQHFEIRQSLREAVTFEQRNLLTGSPPARLDLVSCRNLLIYMKSHLQDQLITRFHQALAPQGLLFIGQSESLGLVGNSLFAPIDPYHRLFCRR